MYKRQELHGTNIRRYHHGEYSSITTYENGKLNGVMKIFSPSGILTKETFYFLDEPVCQFIYHDNKRLKEIQVYKKGEAIYERKWNSLGLEITDEDQLLGITTKTQRHASGNLRSETSFKGGELHGLSWEFDNERNLKFLSLYIHGKQVFRSEKTDVNDIFRNTLFPDSSFELAVKIELEEN